MLLFVLLMNKLRLRGTKRILHMSDAALNDARQALVDLEAKHSQLGLNRAGARRQLHGADYRANRG